MRYSKEPFFWAMFSAGGMILALLLPALIVVTGFLVPAEDGFLVPGGGIEGIDLFDIFDNWFFRIVIFGIAFLGFFHAAHRIRHTLVDLGLRAYHTPIGVVSYLVAAAATVWAASVVI